MCSRSPKREACGRSTTPTTGTPTRSITRAGRATARSSETARRPRARAATISTRSSGTRATATRSTTARASPTGGAMGTRAGSPPWARGSSRSEQRRRTDELGRRLSRPGRQLFDVWHVRYPRRRQHCRPGEPERKHDGLLAYAGSPAGSHASTTFGPIGHRLEHLTIQGNAIHDTAAGAGNGSGIEIRSSVGTRRRERQHAHAQQDAAARR